LQRDLRYWRLRNFQLGALMNSEIEASIMIVGAGPIGLTLAINLASRGIDVVMVEVRRTGEPPNVKCNQVSARSMEIFRRLDSAFSRPTFVRRRY